MRLPYQQGTGSHLCSPFLLPACSRSTSLRLSPASHTAREHPLEEAASWKMEPVLGAHFQDALSSGGGRRHPGDGTHGQVRSGRGARRQGSGREGEPGLWPCPLATSRLLPPTGSAGALLGARGWPLPQAEAGAPHRHGGSSVAPAHLPVAQVLPKEPAWLHLPAGPLVSSWAASATASH